MANNAFGRLTTQFKRREWNRNFDFGDLLGFVLLNPTYGTAGGAVASGIIGGIGLAFCGTAVGITLGPFIAIGAGLSFAGWGIYKLGKNSRSV